MKTELKFKHGVWYKHIPRSDCILKYNENADPGNFAHIGYWTGSFDTWRGFDESEKWVPATKEELKALGNEWEQYPWIEPDEEIQLNEPKNYKYAIIKDGEYNLLIIEDLKKPGMKSVTNDIDKICDTIIRETNSLHHEDSIVIVYKDSEDNWDMYDFVLSKFVLMKLQSLEEVLMRYREFVPIRYN